MPVYFNLLKQTIFFSRPFCCLNLLTCNIIEKNMPKVIGLSNYSDIHILLYFLTYILNQNYIDLLRTIFTIGNL